MTTSGMPPKELRDAVDRAVHRAVCEVTESTGVGQCALYAFAGMVALKEATGRRYIPQSGSVDVIFQTEPVRRSVFLNADVEDGVCGFARGEYHCWLCLPGGVDPESGETAAAEWVDFSSRHYKSLMLLPKREEVVQVGGMMIIARTLPVEPWTAPDPPDYLWTEGGINPDTVYFRPTRECCSAFLASVEENAAQSYLAAHLVRRYLAEEGVPAARKR